MGHAAAGAAVAAQPESPPAQVHAPNVPSLPGQVRPLTNVANTARPAGPPERRPNANSPGAADPRQWAAIVQQMREKEPRWAAMYEHGVPAQLSPQQVRVTFPEGSFFGRQAQSPDGTEALRRAAHTVLQGRPEILIQFALEVSGVSLAQQEAAQVDERKEAIKKKAMSHPRVLEALKVFPELAQKHDVQVD
jgi:DNA polymerase III subunit gamma/tau